MNDELPKETLEELLHKLRTDPEYEEAWVRKMAALEDELGPIPPNGATGNPHAERKKSDG